jgi:hypothetical protein
MTRYTLTTETAERVIDEAAATEALVELEKVERALDGAYQVIADSLGLKDRKAVDAHIKNLRDKVIKPYLEQNGGSIADGELGVSARIQPRANYSYDLVTLVESEEGQKALVEAATHGWLKLDNTGLERFRGKAGATWADKLFAFRQVGNTPNLIVERGK